MAISSYLTPEILDELVWAMHITLNKVSLEEIENPEEAELWSRAKKWLDEAESAKREPGETNYLAPLSRFPLSGAQLRRLQQSVDRVAAEHESNQSSPFQLLMNLPIVTKRGLVSESWRHARHSSTPIAAVLVLSLAVTGLVALLDVTIWKDFPWLLLVVTEAILTSIALAIWFRHHLDLREHHEALADLRVLKS